MLASKFPPIASVEIEAGDTQFSWVGQLYPRKKECPRMALASKFLLIASVVILVGDAQFS